MTDKRFAMEVDARKLDISEMCSKYPTVAKAVEAIRATLADGRLPRGHERVVYWSKQYIPVTIVHVGRNFVLLSLAENQDAKIAIPEARISAIRWGNNKPTLEQGFHKITD